MSTTHFSASSDSRVVERPSDGEQYADIDTTRASSEATEQLFEKVGEVKRNIEQLGALARKAAQETVGGLRHSALAKLDRKRERASELERGVEGRIRERPLRSVLVAAGVGMILGFLWRRR